MLSDPPLCVTEEREGVEDVGDQLADLPRCPPPPPPPPPPASPASTGGKNITSLMRLLPLLCLLNMEQLNWAPSTGVFQSSSLRGNGAAHYVNVPFSRPPAKTNKDPNESGSNRTHRGESRCTEGARVGRGRGL